MTSAGPPRGPGWQNNVATPPSKQNLKSWWKGFKIPSKTQEPHENRPQGIFGVPLRQSITYANVAISLVDETGKSYIYGYVPIVVAKCGVFLKEKATEVEGIFRLNGSEKRIKELKTVFDSPDRYGKGLVWDGYTVHDAANVLRRYLNDLPEPVVPLDLYEKFREPLRGATKQAVGDADGPQFVENFDMEGAIKRYQQLITELPPLNRQLLLYILDLLAVFAAKSDQNRMNSQNLAAIFQPGMLSHPNHAMAPEEYRLNQCVIIFLIENQDHFLIGMQGTEADEKTVEAVQKGTPLINLPPAAHPRGALATPFSKPPVTRSSSNASAGAESVAKEGQIRRNKSVSSRHSRHSNGAPSPGSPALATTPTGGLARSNTLPSKRSPAIKGGRFPSHHDSTVAPLTPVTPGFASVAPPAVVEEVVTPPEESAPALVHPATAPTPDPSVATGRSQDRLLEPHSEVSTPTKERRLPSLFQRAPSGPVDAEIRQPNKLRKKRFPGSANASAQSSTASLPHSAAGSPSVEVANPLEHVQQESVNELRSEEQQLNKDTSEPTPRVSQVSSNNTLHPHTAEATLKTKKSPPTSLHSSFNESSDMDQVDEPVHASAMLENSEREKKKRWRLSRRKEDLPPTSNPVTSPHKLLGSNVNAEGSSSTVGSAIQKPRKSFSGETSETSAPCADVPPLVENGNRDGKDESKGWSGWIKKVRDRKENHEHSRNGTRDRPGGLGTILPVRGKSLDIKRPADDEQCEEQDQPVEPRLSK